MRLTKEKIESLSKQLLDELKKQPEVSFKADESLINLEIKTAITADLKREDEIDLEVREILKKHMNRINLENMDYSVLFRKTKQKIIKERGLVI
jgi:hypothetical protein